MATGLSLLEDDLNNDGLFYKSNSQAMREDVLPRSRGLTPTSAVDASMESVAKSAPTSAMQTQTAQAKPEPTRISLEELMGSAPAPKQETQTQTGTEPAKAKSLVSLNELMGMPDAPEQPAQQEPVKSQSSPATRGLVEGGYDSAKSTAVGGAALLADTFGAKDTAKSFFTKYQELQDEKQKQAQPYESFGNVMDGKASFTDFLGYWGGYAVGQVAQTVAAAGVGAAAGSVVPGAGTAAGAISGVLERGAAQEGIKKLVANKLEGMVAENVTKNLAKGMAAKEAEKLALNQSARSVFRQLGAAAAVTGQNVMMEGSSIYGDARDEAEKRGEEVNLGKVWTGTILAAATETAMDFVGAKGFLSATGGGNIFKNIAKESFKGGLREGSTEAVQTGFERFGAGKDLSTTEAIHDYIDSAAAGAVGGVLFGTTKGGMMTLRGKEDDKDKGSPSETIAKFQDKSSTSDGRDELFAAMQENAPVAAALKAAGITSGQDARFESVLNDAIRVSMLGSEGQQTQNTNSAGFIPESAGQVKAQVEAVADGRKPAAVTGVEEAASIDTPGLFKHEVTNPETGEKSVVISKDEGMGEKIQKRADEVGFKQAMGEALGYVEPMATTTPHPDDVVVQQRDDKTGHVITEQIVAPENVDKVAPVDGTTTSVKSVEEAAAERQQADASEKATKVAEPAPAPATTVVDEAAHQAATSPMNDKPQPTEAQKKSGNYAKGHVKLGGMDIAIENPEGSERSGVSPEGKPWSMTMANHYGYIKGTVGNDKDHVDVFIGPNHNSNKVFVVDQVNPDGSFDEHKALLGFNTEEEARAGYLANYETGWKGLGAISEMPVPAFKSWVKDGKKGKPLALAAPALTEKPATTQEVKNEQPTQADSKAAKDESPKGEVAKVTPAKADKTVEQGKQAAPAKETKVKAEPKPNAKQIKLEAIDSWEDNDDGTVAHIPFNKLPKQAQNDWIAAYAPDDGEKPYSTAEYHDQLVRSVMRDARAKRINAIAEQNRKAAEPDFSRKDGETVGEYTRDFSYTNIKSVEDLSKAVNNNPEFGGKWSAVRVPIGNAMNKVVGVQQIIKAAELFGKKVVFFQAAPGSRDFFNGAVIPGTDTIFINVNANRPAIRIFGHELVHTIRNTDVKTYQRMTSALLPYIDRAGFEAYASFQMGENNLKDANKILEEAVADLVGDRFGEPEFWSMLAEENPTMFEQLAKIVMQFIDETLSKLSGRQDMKSSGLVTDLQTARTIIARELAAMKPVEEKVEAPVAEYEDTGARLPSFSRKEGESFYSALKRTVETAKQESAQAKDWISIINNLPGVKKEEVEWTGVSDWLALKDGQEKVTRQQVVDFIGSNQLHLNDLILSGEGEYLSDGKLRDMLDEQYQSEGLDLSAEFMDREELLSELGLEEHKGTKYGQSKWTLAGGTDHVEIVLYDKSKKTGRYKQKDDTHFGDLTNGKTIGWLRANVRKDADGNNVLFLEELQSQRGQDARAKDENGNAPGFVSEGGTVPDSAFVKDTRAWTALLLKRAVAYAQEQGINRIAWTHGDQQNERYSLKKVVDQISYVKDKKTGKVTLSGVKDGKTVMNKEVEPENLSAVVDKQMADQINGNVGLELDNEFETSGIIAGSDLEVHDKDLRPYYNTTVPSVAKDFLKKFGGKVEVMNIQGTGEQLGFVMPEKLQQQVQEDGLPMFSRKQYESQFDDLPANVQAMAVAKGHVSPPTIKARIEALKPKFWLRVVQGTFDKFRSIRDLDNKAYLMSRMSNGPQDGAVSTILHYGQVFNDDGALNIKKGTKGLLEILKNVGPELDRYLLWVAANRADNLSKQDREHFFTEEEIKALKKINLGTTKDGKSRAALYIKTLQDMSELNRSVLDVAKSAGLIDDAAYKKFAGDIWYVPFYRQMGDDKTLSAAQTSSAMVGQYLSKTLKGSSRGLNDLLENVLMNWSHILSSSMKNQAAVTTLTAAQQMGGIASKLSTVDSQFGKDADGNVVPLKYTVKVMENGKPVHYRVDDEFLLQSLDSIATMGGSNVFMDVAREFKTTLTRFISLSPTFKINNLIRDSIQSLAMSDNGHNPVANAFNGYRLYKDNRAEALAGGGLFAMGNAFDGDQSSSVKRMLKTGVRQADILTTTDQAKDWFGKAQDKYDEISDAMENSNRIALYQQLREKGATHLEASFAARDLQDFSLQGSWAAIRFAAQVLPYFNARLQGLYKMGRDGIDPVRSVLFGNPTDSDRQKAAKFMTVLGAITAVELALYFWQRNDDDWKKREEWDKDAFYWFKLPGTEKAVRIPKPFELGAIGTLVGRVAEQMTDSEVEGKLFAQRFAALLHDNFAINPIPQFIRPIDDLRRNKDGFTDRPIESMGMERMSKENRVNPGTSPVAIGLAKMNSWMAEGAAKVTGGDAQNMQLSPIQVDYLLRGYLGWVGTVMQSSSVAAFAPFKKGESPESRIDDVFIVGNFVKTMPQSQSKYVTSFYENAKQIATVASDYQTFVNMGEVKKAEKLLDSKRDVLALSKVYAQTTNQLSLISHRIKMVTDTENMDGAEKRIEIDRLNGLRSEIAKRAEELRIRRSREN